MDYPKSVPNVGLVNGKFVDENTTTGQVGSLIPATWGSAVTDEILNVIMGGGYVPDENESGQLLQAIKEIIADNIPPEKVRTTLAEYGITDAYTKAVTYTKEEIEAKLKNLSALPVGAMVPFPRGAVPAGFLEANGDTFSPETYPDLAAYLGGNTLPETRAEFLRGWDHQRGVDAGRVIGSYQTDMFKSHTHGAKINQAAAGSGFTTIYSTGTQNDTENYIQSTGGNETRPRNLAVMWCIKAWNAPVNQGNIDIAVLADDVQKVRTLTIQGAYNGIIIWAGGLNSVVSLRVGEVLVKDSAGTATRLNALSSSINLATVGANGLDAGALAASSFYSVWAIANGATKAGIAALCPVLTGSVTAGSAVVAGLPSTASMRPGMAFSGSAFPGQTVILSVDGPSQITASAPALSTTATAALRFVYEPVMPAGYTAKARMGMFLTGSNGVPMAFTQIDNLVRFDPTAGSNTLNYPVAVSGAAASPVSVSLANLVPPTARKVSLVAGSTGGYVGFSAEGAFASTPGTGYLAPAQLNGFAFAGGYNASGPVPTTQGDIIMRRMNFLFCATAATAVAEVMGWEDGL